MELVALQACAIWTNIAENGHGFFASQL